MDIRGYFDRITGRSGEDRRLDRPITLRDVLLAREKASSGVLQKRKLLVDLKMQTEALTRKDIASWKNAWQAAIDVENPKRGPLYDIYGQVLIDLHLTGCISQRKMKVLQKPFVFVDESGKEADDARQIFEAQWFMQLLSFALDAQYWGHSLIQLGDIVKSGNTMGFSSVDLVPRRHVVPEYGVITVEQGDDWKTGVSYREGDIASWCIEVGEQRDLGLLLKCAPQSLAKKNMLAYWDTFGEIFGMPIRIGKTMSQDPNEIEKMESMLDSMGAASWGLFPEGTEIDIKETARGDAYNVYDKRITRCNSEISKGILNQTMTVDDGSSRAQGEVHLEIFDNICRADASALRFMVNGSLIPRMVVLGFPLSNVHMEWEDAASYTPAEQRELERMLLQEFEIDHQYFIDKYKIPIKGVKKPAASSFFD